PNLEINLVSVNPTINCAGDNTGAITATAEGGLGNYVYTLEDTMGNPVTATQNSPGVFTELVAGTYVVTVDSDDCNTTSSTITITEPLAPLNVTFNTTNVTCSGNNNGVLEIIATGGTGIIKYAISPQLNQFFETNIFENLAPGTYEVIVQDVLGCFETFTFTITEPAPVVLSVVGGSVMPELCDGDSDGEFSIDISGGTLPYSVSLDDINGVYTVGTATQTEFDFTGLSGGDHVVYILDDQGCASEWNITFPESVRIEPTVTIEYLCVNNVATNIVTVTVDDSITDLTDIDYSLNGGPYQASNIFNDVPPGTDNFIDVRHTNGCIQTTDLFDITQAVPLTLTLSEGGLNEIVATPNGGSGGYVYTLNNEDYGSTNTFIITQSGTYVVTVTDSSGCMAVASIEMEFIEVCIPDYFTPNNDGVEDGWAPGCSENYPNLEFDIFDRYGRVVAKLKVGEYWDGKYNDKELPTGDYWYVVRVNSSENDRSFVGHFTLYR
uniref:T9SS type B sorting domain-containing protein n=2 Tax=uncultured Lacinutrix sp. TaxID=574032 RepID=UPI00263879B3